MNEKYYSFYFLRNKKKNSVLEFLCSMDKKILTKTIDQMKLLEIYGIDTSKVSIKKFQNGIWKIRTKDASNNIRLFFFIIEKNIYYIYGFFKNTQKTPEGKKITINNIKKELVQIYENDEINKYIEKIDYKKIK